MTGGAKLLQSASLTATRLGQASAGFAKNSPPDCFLNALPPQEGAFKGVPFDKVIKKSVYTQIAVLLTAFQTLEKQHT